MGAQITALSSRIVEGRPRGFSKRTYRPPSNDLGEYRIANLASGKYIHAVCSHESAECTGDSASAQTITADTCYPGPVLKSGLASAMDLPAGRESKVDFTLNEVPAAHVRGEITGLPDGRGSGLRMVKRGADFGSNLPGNVRDGKFDFRVPAGSYMLSADYFEAGKRLTARVPIDVGSSDVDNLVVHLDGGFTVTGIVRVVSQSGRTLTQQFGANLRSSDPAAGTAQIKWEPDHISFAINEMVPGSYRLDAFPLSPFYVKSATLAGQDILNNEVPISQAAGPIEIQLRDDGGSIEGDAVDANGQPAAAGIMLLRGAIRAANLTTQPNGHFKLQNVAPGDYTIFAWDNPDEVAYADPDWMRRNGAAGMAVTVAAGQSQQIKLTVQSGSPAGVGYLNPQQPQAASDSAPFRKRQPLFQISPFPDDIAHGVDIARERSLARGYGQGPGFRGHNAEGPVIFRMDFHAAETSRGEGLPQRLFRENPHLERLSRAAAMKKEIVENLCLTRARAIYQYDTIADFGQTVFEQVGEMFRGLVDSIRYGKHQHAIPASEGCKRSAARREWAERRAR